MLKYDYTYSPFLPLFLKLHTAGGSSCKVIYPVVSILHFKFSEPGHFFQNVTSEAHFRMTERETWGVEPIDVCLNNTASDSEKAGIKSHCHRCHSGIMGLSLETVLALCSGDETSRIPRVKWHLGEWQEFLFWARGGTVTEKSVPSRSGAEGSQSEEFQLGNSSVGRFGSLVCSQTLCPWHCRLSALC